MGGVGERSGERRARALHAGPSAHHAPCSQHSLVEAGGVEELAVAALVRARDELTLVHLPRR